MRRIAMIFVAGAIAVLGFGGGTAATAHTGTDAWVKPACTATVPLTTPCAADVSASGNTYTVTVPGVGVLSFSLDPATGAVNNPTSTAGDGFTALTPMTDGDGVLAAFTNDATGETIAVDADVRRKTATSAPTVAAAVRSAGDHHCDHDGASDGTRTLSYRTTFDRRTSYDGHFRRR